MAIHFQFNPLALCVTICGITLEKALQKAYSDDLNVDGSYIEPSEVSIFIDQNSVGEEDNCEIDHLISEKQLAANAAIVLRNSSHTEDVDSKSSNISITSNTSNRNGTAYPSEMSTNNYSWVNRNLDL
ncbi:hypothetical protein ILUMI_19151 [Ignelater luminosus]|uniref:Uncharacterized protein n=1 Tax=Ignelater luminosus TaxID=2038154 RepID=A0A8K0G3H0_IGNLU|nr:hypothetical protein ILUMI_19151 [Ignelater luminosus]